MRPVLLVSPSSAACPGTRTCCDSTCAKAATLPLSCIARCVVGKVQYRRRPKDSLQVCCGWRWDDDPFEEEGVGEAAAEDEGGRRGARFEEGVRLFNQGRFYECHDTLESLWYNSGEPSRSTLHGILQCSVGLHHLLNRNHRGAMVELGEGLAKIRRQRFQGGPFHQFEHDISMVLEYIYNTQLEHAACSEDLCITMDGSEQSYQLLGNFAAGEHLYEIQRAEDNLLHICFLTMRPNLSDEQNYATALPKVRLPSLNANLNDFLSLERSM